MVNKRRDVIFTDFEADLIALNYELHCIDFRKIHKCNCKRKVDYGNGRWYCEAMQKYALKKEKKNTDIILKRGFDKLNQLTRGKE